VICTYGPLGYLIFFCFSSYTGVWSLYTLLILVFVNCAGICLAARRLSCPLQALALALLVWAAANTENRTDLVVDLGLFSWALLCHFGSGRRLAMCASVLVVLAAFLSLAKTSFLVLTPLLLLFLSIELYLRGCRRVGLILMPAYLFLFLLGWLLAAQSVFNLPIFLSLSLSVVQSYNQALGTEGQAFAADLGRMVLLLSIPAVLIRGLMSSEAFDGGSNRVQWLRRLALLCWAGLLVLGNWKHGFVRFDAGHAPLALGFVPPAMILLETIPCISRPALYSARGFAFAAAALSLFILHHVFFGDLATSLASPFRVFGMNIADVACPFRYRERMKSALAGLKQEVQLPALRSIVGTNSVDVFGQFQGDALDNGLNYYPRPSFQSYAASDRRLMALNEAFYLSPAAPDYVLYKPFVLDQKVPALEDAWVLRALLVNYVPVAAERDYNLFRRLRTEPPQLRQVSDTIIQPGERIPLPLDIASNFWLELDLQPTILGRIEQFIFKPSAVRLEAWDTNRNLLLRRRAPPIMLEAGFLAAPLIIKTNDVLAAYDLQPRIQPAAYSLHLLPHDRPYWRSHARARVYVIDNLIGPAARVSN